MKSLPHTVKFYRRTPEFNEKSCPIQLKRSQSTKTGVWGRSVVVEGQVVFRIFESPDEEFIIDPDNRGLSNHASNTRSNRGVGLRFSSSSISEQLPEKIKRRQTRSPPRPVTREDWLSGSTSRWSGSREVELSSPAWEARLITVTRHPQDKIHKQI